MDTGKTLSSKGLGTAAAAFLLALALTAVGFAPRAVAAEDPVETKHLRIAFSYKSFSSLDPHITSTSVNKAIIHNIFNGLTRLKPGHVGTEFFEPDLATRWELGADQKTWTFYLRKDVKWQKGYGKFTAHDVKFSFDRVKNPKTASAWYSNVDIIDRVEVVDDYTVRIITKRPDPAFMWRVISFQQGKIVSQKAVTEKGKKHRFDPVGTGPWQLEKQVQQRYVTVVEFPEHYRGAPKIKKITWFFIPDKNARELAFERGTVDLYRLWGNLSEIIPRVRKDHAVEIFNGPGASMWDMFINSRIKPLDKVKVRQAMAHALDTKQFVEAFLGESGRVRRSVLPYGAFGWTLDGLPRYDFDLAKARKLMAEAGFPNGFNLGDNITHRTWGNWCMTFAQAAWKKLGITMNLKLVDDTTYYPTMRKYITPVAIYGFSRLPDADVWLRRYYHTSAVKRGYNISLYTAIDKEIEAAAGEMDVEKRKAMYKQISIKLMEDLPTIPFVLAGQALAHKKFVRVPYRPQGSLLYGLEYNEDWELRR